MSLSGRAAPVDNEEDVTYITRFCKKSGFCSDASTSMVARRRVMTVVVILKNEFNCTNSNQNCNNYMVQ